MFDLDEELKKLPAQPGVYLMHDAKDEIIYIGKAISLKNRVRQYFQSSRDKSSKIRQMVSRIARFEYIITDSELEALVLECNLIKEHRPRYNTMLKDDKAYPYIKVTISEEFPRVLFSRTMKKDRNRYFGPYTSAGAVKETINLIHRIYRIRTCSRSLPRDTGKERPCLNYHIHQCDAPCQGMISREKYAENVSQALEFLNGHYDKLLKDLEAKMLEASERMDYEKAIEYRDLLENVKKVAQKQKITSNDEEDRDIIAMARADRDAVVQVFFVREGKLIEREHFHVTVGTEESRPQILGSFIKQFYAGTPYLPRELWLQEKPEDEELITQWLSSRKGRRIRILVPKAGQKEKLVELAEKNARLVLSQDTENIRREELRTIGAMKQVGEWLGLERVRRMEAYDISNISGYESVGSMVVYEDGRPKRSDYRKFRIRTVVGPNDYASMREVLLRRFTHGLEEQKKIREQGIAEEMGRFSRFPDLILMDGGRGQVNIALEVLEELGLDIPVCGMVKDDYHRTRGIYYQNVEIPIDRYSEGFRLVTRIQDEAHRFAIEYHRSLRGKDQVHSVLDDIPGIGPARRKSLMRMYRSPEEIRAADVEELTRIPGMNRSAAESVYQFFHENLHGKEEQPRYHGVSEMKSIDDIPGDL
ncbi:MAG: excinuclease ABC subunit UvrC [Clostridiales bacterium]|nr:excinuclease ABC subunit UvrC [Clostridiales bacterium]